MAVVKERIELEEARRVAWRVQALIEGACLRLEVAGSIRRQRPDVGDVELVAVPRMVRRVVDLRGGVEERNLLDERCADLLAEGIFAPRLSKTGRQAVGSRHKRLRFEGAAIDLFIVQPPAQWGLIMALRTGPAEFSRAFVMNRFEIFKSERGTYRSGMLPLGFEVRDGALWRGGTLIPTPTEEEVFRAIGAPYLAPEVRW